MAKTRVKNVARGPRGIRAANGAVVTIPRGKTVELDLSDAVLAMVKEKNSGFEVGGRADPEPKASDPGDGKPDGGDGGDGDDAKTLAEAKAKRDAETAAAAAAAKAAGGSGRVRPQ